MDQRDDLIAGLSRDLAPVRKAPDVNRLALAWFLLGAIFVVVATRLAGPLRPGVFAQFTAEPRFLLETLLGVVAIAWMSLVAFRGAGPAALTRRFAIVGAVLMLLWLAQYVFGLINPALEPAERGTRRHCSLEVMLHTTPLILAAT